jgi:hypothetical protein
MLLEILKVYAWIFTIIWLLWLVGIISNGIDDWPEARRRKREDAEREQRWKMYQRQEADRLDSMLTEWEAEFGHLWGPAEREARDSLRSEASRMRVAASAVGRLSHHGAKGK